MSHRSACQPATLPSAPLGAVVEDCETPAYLIDPARVRRAIDARQPLRAESGLRLLYAIKALPLGALLAAIGDRLDGLAASSLNEARLAARSRRPGQSLHLTTPGLRPEEMAVIGRLCSHLSFNSLGQFERHAAGLPPGCSPGLRLNPQCPGLDDVRYDPCRPDSKLGEPVTVIERLLATDPGRLAAVRGLHFHVSFAARSYDRVLAALARIEPLLPRWPGPLAWINLGGGVLPGQAARWQELAAAVGRLRGLGLAVYHEPGKGLVGQAGCLVTTVLDRFRRDGRQVLVLDTSVAHHPEVFEYQRRPPLLQEVAEGAHRVLLAGASCLAGDLFGEYRFEAVPEPGQRLVFTDAGAYSLVKASRFNGLALPAVYLRQPDGGLRCLWRDGFDDFLRQWGGDGPRPDAHLREV